jgi:non-specific serine/threonine protein kinase
LLTLTGSGGCGKTRLAIELANRLIDQFDDGVWWVELGPVAEPAFVAQAVTRVLGLNEGTSQPLSETLVNYLRAKRLLLIWDNCEHLIVACAQLAETLLRAAPHLQILATSREGLGISGERLWPVPSLSVPDPHRPLSLDKLNQSEAVRLFVSRAIAVRPDFKLTEPMIPAVAQVCQQLAGMPLALELAAAWVKVLTVEQIASRLADRFTLLSMGSRTALPRHQTLRGALDWSYDLLSPTEQVLFRHLSVFAGGFTLAAAEAVCAGEHGSGRAGECLKISAPQLPSPSVPLLELLAQLVSKSLVLMDQSSREARYRLLEPVRQYGQDKLWLSAEEAMLRRRHLHWFAQLAERAEPELLSANQTVWLDRLEREYANLSAALRWTIEGEPVDVAAGLRLGGALWRFWDLRGHITEGREQLLQLLALPGAAAWTEARAKALFSAGMLALYQTDSLNAATLLEESLTVWQELDHAYGLALTLQHLGFVAHRLGQHAMARARYEESLTVWREIDGQWGLAETLGLLGNLAYWEGDYAAAQALQTESLQIKRQLGEKRGLAFSVWSLGKVAQAQGDYASARSLYAEAIMIMRQVADKGGMPFLLEAFGYLAVVEGYFQRGACLLGAAEVWREITGSALPPISQADHERDMADIQVQLGVEAFATAWAEGRAMTLEQAIEYALQTG